MTVDPINIGGIPRGLFMYLCDQSLGAICYLLTGTVCNSAQGFVLAVGLYVELAVASVLSARMTCVSLTAVVAYAGGYM